MLCKDKSQGIAEILRMVNFAQKPILALIAGGSCCGKTYLSKKIAAKLEEKSLKSTVVSLDDYFRGAGDSMLPRDSRGANIFDDPGSYHKAELIEDINLLLSVRDKVWIPEYDISRNERVSRHGKLILFSPVIIVEGLYVIDFLSDVFPGSIKIYVDAGEHILLRRRIKRDTVLYNVASSLVEKKFKLKVLPYHRQLVEPQKTKADIVIINE